MHRPQRHAGKIAGKNFFQHLPLNRLVEHRQFRMGHHVRNAAFRFARKWRTGSRRFHQHRIQHRAVGKRLLVQHFNLPAANREIARNRRLGFRHAPRCGKKPLLQTERSGRLLVHIAQQLAVQRPRMPEINAHPLGRAALRAIPHTQRFLRSLRLQLVSQRIVVSRIGVMQETPDRTHELHGIRRKLFFRRARSPQILAVAHDLPQPICRLIIAQSPRRLFDVRLQVKNRIAVATQALFRQPV